MTVLDVAPLGREPTEQEINLWMDQAKYMGDL